MTIAIIGELPGGTAAQDEAMLRELDISGAPPAGAVVRLAGPTDKGWRVMSVWDSVEQWENFRSTRLEPLFRKTGREVPTFEVWQIESFLRQPQQ